MKIWLALLLFTAIIMAAVTSSPGTQGALGERISANLVKMRALQEQQLQIAYAGSERADSEIGVASVQRHIAYLRHSLAMHCDGGQRLLAASARHYPDGLIDPRVNQQLTDRVTGLCE